MGSATIIQENAAVKLAGVVLLVSAWEDRHKLLSSQTWSGAIISLWAHRITYIIRGECVQEFHAPRVSQDWDIGLMASQLMVRMGESLGGANERDPRVAKQTRESKEGNDSQIDFATLTPGMQWRTKSATTVGMCHIKVRQGGPPH